MSSSSSTALFQSRRLSFVTNVTDVTHNSQRFSEMMDFLLFVFSRLAAAILLPQQQSPEDESKPLPIVGFKSKCSIKSVVLCQWRQYTRNRKRSDEKIKTKNKSFLCFCPPKSKKEIGCYSKWGAIDEKILKKYFRIQNTWSSISYFTKSIYFSYVYSKSISPTLP